MRKSLIISVILFLSTLAFPQEFNKLKLDSLFSRIEKNDKGMGAISLYKNGKEIYSNSIGFADINRSVKNSANTKFRIGSISKTFTAVIILQLIEENKLNLETTLDKFFPQIQNSAEITIEHLLRHRSGIHNFTSDPDYQSYNQNAKTEAEMLEIFNQLKPDFKPGEKYSYSNTGYVLLSYIAEKIEGKKYSEILNSRIVKPLKLEATYLGGKINSIENEAQSYSKTKEWLLSTETDMSIPLGAGGIVSTPLELNRFFEGLFTGELVSEKSLEQMTNIIEGYGMGIFSFPFSSKKGFGHTGGIDGFSSMAGYFPHDSLFFAYCSNGISMPLNNILIGVFSIYWNERYILPDFKPIIQLTSEDLDKYLGVYGSSTFPLKITITKESNKLIAQATGQHAFPLECYEQDKFQFESAGIKLEFQPAEKIMILKQAGMTFELKKEN